MVKKHGFSCIISIFITQKTLKHMLQKKENKTIQLNSWQTFKSNLTFKTVDFEVFVNTTLQIYEFPFRDHKNPANQMLGYVKNTKTAQNISISGFFFQLCLEQISLLPFIFSHIFDLLNASKITSQLILTLRFS